MFGDSVSKVTYHADPKKCRIRAALAQAEDHLAAKIKAQLEKSDVVCARVS